MVEQPIGIVGAGRIGLGLAELLTAAGRDVVVGSRRPADPRFAGSAYAITALAEAMGRETVILALPHTAIEPTLAELGGPAEGAVVIDPASAVAVTAGRIGSGLPLPHGRWLQGLLPGVRVTRAFTHIQDELLVSRARRQPRIWAVATAGDDPEALSVTDAVVDAAGYVPVRVGTLDQSAILDPGGPLFPNMFLPEDLRDHARPGRGAPNLFIVYVRDVRASSRFYNELFGLTPKFESPRFVAYQIAPGVELAVWSGHADALAGDPRRTSEVCLNLRGGPAAIEEYYRRWSALGVTVVQEPHDDVFGRTFVVADPDGNLIRVAPVD